MATLPRVQPRCFYDLVIEVALIRPGPIQGRAVNPYIRRRRGEEPVTYLHPRLEPILARTLGVPLFQEQLMEMATAVAGFSAAESDELRQAMAARRSEPRMMKLKSRFYEGMAENGITGAGADQLFDALSAFRELSDSPSRIRCPLRISCTARRGSRCTTRRRFLPRR